VSIPDTSGLLRFAGNWGVYVEGFWSRAHGKEILSTATSPISGRISRLPPDLGFDVWWAIDPDGEVTLAIPNLPVLSTSLTAELELERRVVDVVVPFLAWFKTIDDVIAFAASDDVVGASHAQVQWLPDERNTVAVLLSLVR
jgi:hypothetical protein